MTGFQDFLPTACAVAGLAPPASTDGISLLPTLKGKGGQREHAFLYWEHPRGGELCQAIRMGEWKAVQPRAGAAFELYHLREDIGETDNLAERHPDVLAGMKALMHAAHTSPRDFADDEKGSKAALYRR
jgi:arylsulfatase A-like enzyme